MLDDNGLRKETVESLYHASQSIVRYFTKEGQGSKSSKDAHWSKTVTEGKAAAQKLNQLVQQTTVVLDQRGSMDIDFTRKNEPQHLEIENSNPVERRRSTSKVKRNDPPQMLEVFKLAVRENRLITQKVMKRQYELVKALENVEKYTGPDKGNQDFPKDGVDARVKITWTDIVNRMVKYCKMHNFDEGNEDTCTLVVKTLTNSLRRERSDTQGNPRTNTRAHIHFVTHTHGFTYLSTRACVRA